MGFACARSTELVNEIEEPAKVALPVDAFEVVVEAELDVVGDDVGGADAAVEADDGGEAGAFGIEEVDAKGAEGHALAEGGFEALPHGDAGDFAEGEDVVEEIFSEDLKFGGLVGGEFEETGTRVETTVFKADREATGETTGDGVALIGEKSGDGCRIDVFEDEDRIELKAAEGIETEGFEAGPAVEEAEGKLLDFEAVNDGPVHAQADVFEGEIAEAEGANGKGLGFVGLGETDPAEGEATGEPLHADIVVPGKPDVVESEPGGAARAEQIARAGAI